MSFNTVVFDLDGTLIDSFYGIQDAFNRAFLKVFDVENTTNIKPYIGPPIKDVLTSVKPDVTPDKCDKFVTAFKLFYDTVSYKETKLYDNAIELLCRLGEKNKSLFIATNKRLTPTQLILDHLLLSKYFETIYCIDSQNFHYDTKGIMLQSLLNNHLLSPSEVLMIGDTIHDFKAAKENDVTFAFVNFGYGRVESPDYAISDLRQILDII
jgi:phosphoglycolate phosphatase